MNRRKDCQSALIQVKVKGKNDEHQEVDPMKQRLSNNLMISYLMKIDPQRDICKSGRVEFKLPLHLLLNDNLHKKDVFMVKEG